MLALNWRQWKRKRCWLAAWNTRGVSPLRSVRGLRFEKLFQSGEGDEVEATCGQLGPFVCLPGLDKSMAGLVGTGLTLE